eukprot:1187866-Rhodomonas_salina.2
MPRYRDFSPAEDALVMSEPDIAHRRLIRKRPRWPRETKTLGGNITHRRAEDSSTTSQRHEGPTNTHGDTHDPGIDQHSTTPDSTKTIPIGMNRSDRSDRSDWNDRPEKFGADRPLGVGRAARARARSPVATPRTQPQTTAVSDSFRAPVRRRVSNVACASQSSARVMMKVETSSQRG